MGLSEANLFVFSKKENIIKRLLCVVLHNIKFCPHTAKWGFWDGKLKETIEKDLAVNENEKRIENTLKRIGIDYAANTKQVITQMIGEEPQASVLDELVRKKFPCVG